MSTCYLRMPLSIVAGLVLAGSVCRGVEFSRSFCPLEGMTSEVEQPFRQELCLNGLWAFQPVRVPDGWVAGRGVPPELPLPKAGEWETTQIKIPSPWNVNSINHDSTGGGMDARTFPSYPEHWNEIRMGWLRKRVTVPAAWRGKRVSLHLEAVAGDCRILVNGKEVGFHFDTSLPGQIDVTDEVRFGERNEILLGIRDHQFYAEKGAYGSLTYPTGSMWLTEAVGVWQDVFLLAKPNVHVRDIFIKPLVGEDVLGAEVELVNASAETRLVQVDLPVYAWINHTDLSRENVLRAPEISWSLGEEVLRLSLPAINLQPGEEKSVMLRGKVKGRLKSWMIWTRGEPHLYAAVAEVNIDGETADRKYQRFGWREVRLANGDFFLNGQRVRLKHEGWHFTGVPAMSRRYAWAWYTLAKEAHINLIRPHAMPHPRYFYDLADEMGMLIMAESGIFASHLDLNYDSEAFWNRSTEHIRQFVGRDRNHPSIVGWSVANEVRCVLVSRAPLDYQERIYDRIYDLCTLVRSLDPTRTWVQSDGDKDLNGRLDVWTIHCGDTHSDVIPPGKLWGVTEGGSSYYGNPGHYEPYVGDRAYRSFEDRMDALAREDYNLVRSLLEEDADILNGWNLVWHGSKPLPLGLTDAGKKQLDLTDGVFFGPFEEGIPGVQPERIAPYSITVNPGLDPSLPLYDPYPLYLAMQAAMHPDGPQPCEWDHFDEPEPEGTAPAIEDPVAEVLFVGDAKSLVYDNLKTIGIPLVETVQAPRFVIVDAASVKAARAASLRSQLAAAVAGGGTVLLIHVAPDSEDVANNLLPEKVRCLDGTASSLIPNRTDERTSSLLHKDVYFAESFVNKAISRCSLGGDLVENGASLLLANNTDWRRWVSNPELSRTISIYRSELENRQAPVLVAYEQGEGTYLVSTLDMDRLGEEQLAFYRKLFANLGVKLAEEVDLTTPAFDRDVLISALSLGRFGAATVEAAMEKSFVDESSIRPVEDTDTEGKAWKMVRNLGDRFILHELGQEGPEDAYACYFSYWVYSPVDLRDLLGAGPDLPQLNKLCFVSERGATWLNGRLLAPHKTEPVDYRTRLWYEKVPLKKGWNQFLVKVASDSLAGADPGTLAVRLFSNDASYDRQLKSAIELAE